MGKLPSEKVAVLATIDPDANTASTFYSDFVNMEEWPELMAVCMAGILGSSATIDFSLLQSTSSTGAGEKAITGKAITQIDTASNDKQQVINLRTDELDVAGGFSFVRAKMTVATSTSDSAAIVLGMGCRHAPADDFDLASVSQIIA